MWHADLSRAHGSGLADLLSEPERERAAAIVDETRRRRWTRARGLLRGLLAAYLSIDAGELVLGAGAQGKPFVEGSSLEFNLSHSGPLVLVAFAYGNPLGVDIEQLHSARITAAVVRRALGDAYAGATETPPGEESEQQLARAWVRHEAALKCRAGSILGPGLPEAPRRGEPWLCDLELAPRAAAALAATRAPRELRLWRWPT